MIKMAKLTLGDAIKWMEEKHDEEIAEMDEYFIDFAYEMILEGLDDLDV